MKNNKKGLHDGVKVSDAHMSHAKSDDSQCAFTDISDCPVLSGEISKNRCSINYKKRTSRKTSLLVKALYVVAAVMMLICVYMVVVNIMYIRNYAVTYGMEISDMKMDAIQYIVTGSISYFVYSVLIFCSGKIIKLLQCGCECGAVELVKNDEAAEEKAGDVAEITKNEIPESEDAIEETEVIEDKK